MGEMRELARNRCSLRLACALLSLGVALGVPLSALAQDAQKPSTPAATGIDDGAAGTGDCRAADAHRVVTRGTTGPGRHECVDAADGTHPR